MTGGHRRAALAGALAVAAITVTAVTVTVVRDVGSGDGTADRSAAHLPANTAKVSRRTLVATATASGRLGYGDATPITVRATGTVTWLPAAGTVIRRGQTLLRADDRPVVLLYGPIPMYRGLGVTTSPTSGTPGTAGPPTAGNVTPVALTPMKGHDVRQLESNLRALGYSGFTVDDTFSTATASAVRRWQHDLSLPVTGRVEIGDVVYAPGPIRIAQDLVRVGTAAGGDPLSYTATAKVVVVDVPVRDSAWAARGVHVAVTLPDGHSVAGVVSAVGTQAAAPRSDGGTDTGGTSDTQNATVPVTVTIADQAALAGLESGPVDVSRVLRERRDVLTVPVSALLALADGGYGVEVVEGGRTRITAVTTGMFADGAVEVSGGITAGQIVGLPG